MVDLGRIIKPVILLVVNVGLEALPQDGVLRVKMDFVARITKQRHAALHFILKNVVGLFANKLNQEPNLVVIMTSLLIVTKDAEVEEPTVITLPLHF